MAIQQSKKQSDLEKRLQLLRRQVYGKGLENQHITTSTNQKLTEFKIPAHRLTNTPVYKSSGIQISSDLIYLHQDLLKILIFASLAIGTQIILFILLQNHVLRINIL